ncbi:MAG TPA: hypothetical protein VJB09_01660 [Candidatus Paceibacterota bacterium]
MQSKIKGLIIFVLIVAVLAVGYSMFVKKPKNEANLVSETTSPTPSAEEQASSEESAKLGQDFLNLLFSLKSLNLDGALFESSTFSSLKDSSIILVPDGTEGRPNPFAPIGAENSSSSAQIVDFLTAPGDSAEPKETSLTPQFPGAEVKPDTQTNPPATTPKKKTN